MKIVQLEIKDKDKSSSISRGGMLYVEFDNKTFSEQYKVDYVNDWWRERNDKQRATTRLMDKVREYVKENHNMRVMFTGIEE